MYFLLSEIIRSAKKQTLPTPKQTWAERQKTSYNVCPLTSDYTKPPTVSGRNGHIENKGWVLNLRSSKTGLHFCSDLICLDSAIPGNS